MEEEGTLETSQGQLLVIIPHLQTGNEGDQYRAIANGYALETSVEIFHWPEVVENLLPTYETEQSITEALEDSTIIIRTRMRTRQKTLLGLIALLTAMVTAMKSTIRFIFCKRTTKSLNDHREVFQE